MDTDFPKAKTLLSYEYPPMPYPELVISLKAKFSRGILAFIDQGTTHMHFAFKEKQRYIKSLSYNKTVMYANEATNISSINRVFFPRGEVLVITLD